MNSGQEDMMAAKRRKSRRRERKEGRMGEGELLREAKTERMNLATSDKGGGKMGFLVCAGIRCEDCLGELVPRSGDRVEWLRGNVLEGRESRAWNCRSGGGEELLEIHR